MGLSRTVWPQSTIVTDGRTDGRTDGQTSTLRQYRLIGLSAMSRQKVKNERGVLTVAPRPMVSIGKNVLYCQINKSAY